MKLRTARTGIENLIGISTHFMPSTHNETIHDAIRMVSEAGFKGFEVVPSLDQAQLGYPFNYPNVGFDLFEATSKQIAELKQALSVFDWVTVHAPHLDWNLASVNRHLRKLTWDYFDKCLEFALEIEAAALTYHLGGQTFGYLRDVEDVNRYNVEYARHVSALAAGSGIPLGFEAGGLGGLKSICDSVEGWGINLDIGHAYMAAGSDEGFFAYIEQLGDRIVEIHHNGVNRYWGGYMEHQPPHMNNTIDFQRTYDRLAEIEYKGPIVCEIQGQDIEQVIEHCQESKEMICGIWTGSRKLRKRWNVAE